MTPEDRPNEPPDWTAGLTDMDPASFRAAAHRVVDLIADYLATVEEFDVLPAVEPGSIAPRFAQSPPAAPEPLDTILADYRALVEPNSTHWQHPGFFAYFPTTASGPGILGEFLTAAIGQNPMLWRTSPVGTELETVVVDWLRQALGLPEGFDGLITDTASTSSLLALAAAREVAGVDASARGLSGRADVPALRVYCSTEAHSSIDKAAMTLGIGRVNVVRVPVDEDYRLRVDGLEAAIARDRAAGHRPIAIVATLGSTSSTSVDPVAQMARVTERERLWFHVDAAYAGSAALVPAFRPLFAGWELADSIVVNPHKWMFAPLDASLLLTRRMDALASAFSMVPPVYLVGREGAVRDFTNYTPQLGRRFRALKLWVMLRAFGVEGLGRRIERHIQLARRFAGWVDADPDWERLAPVPFSTVCFRYLPAALAGREDEPEIHRRLDVANERLIDEVNRTREVFLSHTRLADRFTLRVAIGNLRTEERHVERAWELLRREAASIVV